MKNLNGYWVNKRSGTIHHVLQDTDWNGNIKLWANSCNLQHERSYHFRDVDRGIKGRNNSFKRFLRNYKFICAKPTNDFFVHGLANKVLKRNFSFGLKTDGRVGISKEEFFSKVFNYNKKGA